MKIFNCIFPSDCPLGFSRTVCLLETPISPSLSRYNPSETFAQQPLHFCRRFLFFLGMVALFRFFVRLSVNLMMREKHLSLALHHSLFCRNANMHKEFVNKYLSKISALLSKNRPLVTFVSDTSLPRHTSTSYH